MRSAVLSAAVIAAMTVVTSAQKVTPIHPGKGGSPHVKVEWTIDGANLSIEYGRPALKGRTLHTANFVPYGTPWRTGADEATTLTSDKMLMFGSAHLGAGSYTLWTLPEKDGSWSLIVNKQTGQWGTNYDAAHDVAKVPLTVGKTAKPVEQLTISIDDTPQGATLRIEWGTLRLTTPFSMM